MFRPRRSGPPPFQVMSNSWRGPRDASKTSPRQAGDASSPAPPTTRDAAGEAAKNSAAQTPPPAAAPVTPAAPVSTASARTGAAPPQESRRRKPVQPPRPRTARTIDAAQVRQAISEGVAWIGGVTIEAGAFIARQWRLLAQRLQSRGYGAITELPRRTVVIGLSSLAALILMIVWLNRDGAAEAPVLSQPTGLAVTDSNIDALQRVEPISTGRQAAPPARPDAGPPAAAPDQPRPKLVRSAHDPREKGRRYFVLATYSVNKEEYMLPLLEYLWSQGVEAAAISAHNSGLMQVVALQGFTRDEINTPAHKQYEEALRRIGRKWKAQGGGDDDLRGLYSQEYSGAKARISITKAN